MSDNTNNSNKDTELDLSYLNDIASGSTEFMIEMIDIFLEQTPVYFEQLIQAASEKNWKTVADVAHKIKPTLVFMGVDKAKDDMQVIELKARNQQDLDTIAGGLKEISETCSRLFVQLAAYKKELETKS